MTYVCFTHVPHSSLTCRLARRGDGFTSVRVGGSFLWGWQGIPRIVSLERGFLNPPNMFIRLSAERKDWPINKGDLAACFLGFTDLVASGLTKPQTTLTKYLGHVWRAFFFIKKCFHFHLLVSFIVWQRKENEKKLQLFNIRLFGFCHFFHRWMKNHFRPFTLE